MVAVVAFVTGIMFTTIGANFLQAGDYVGTASKATGLTESAGNYEASTAVDDLLKNPLAFEQVFISVADEVNPALLYKFELKKSFVSRRTILFKAVRLKISSHRGSHRSGNSVLKA